MVLQALPSTCVAVTLLPWSLEQAPQGILAPEPGSQSEITWSQR